MEPVPELPTVRLSPDGGQVSLRWRPDRPATLVRQGGETEQKWMDWSGDADWQALTLTVGFVGPHQCELPEPPEATGTFSERRWDCSFCGQRWVYVRFLRNRRPVQQWHRLAARTVQR